MTRTASCSSWLRGSIIVFAAMAAAIAGAAEPPRDADGFVSLFNGKDLTGWDGDPRLWSVKDGAIRGETTAQNPARGNTFIIWKGGAVADFELRVKFRLSASNNSGIQYRSKHVTDGKVANPWVVRGYQGEVRNEANLPNVSGFIYDEGGKRGRLCLVGEKATWENGKKTVTGQTCTAEQFKKAFKLDDWNEYRIVAKGDNIQQFINGVPTVDFTDREQGQALTEGILALQLHAGRPMWVEFKDIRLKRFEAERADGLIHRAFYTADDGKTYFTDDAARVPPFFKDGKLAVRAQVFTCDGGKTSFVGYVEMYSPENKQALEKALETGRPPEPGKLGMVLVKKPGGNVWVALSPQTVVAYQAIVQVKCPDGSVDNLARVFPE